MTPSTIRLKQLAEDCLPENLIDVQGHYRRFSSAANPEAVLGLIARIEKLEAALEKARHSLVTINDLKVTDRPDAYNEALKDGCDHSGAKDALNQISWTANETQTIAAIDEALRGES